MNKFKSLIKSVYFYFGLVLFGVLIGIALVSSQIDISKYNLGSLAEWFGVIGTLGAVIVSLLLAKSSERAILKRERDARIINNIHLIYKAIGELGEKFSLMSMDMLVNNKMTASNLKSLDEFMGQITNDWRLFVLPEEVMDDEEFSNYNENLNYLLAQMDSIRNVKTVDHFDNLRFGTIPGKNSESDGSIDSLLKKMFHIIKRVEEKRIK